MILASYAQFRFAWSMIDVQETVEMWLVIETVKVSHVTSQFIW